MGFEFEGFWCLLGFGFEDSVFCGIFFVGFCLVLGWLDIFFVRSS